MHILLLYRTMVLYLRKDIFMVVSIKVLFLYFSYQKLLTGRLFNLQVLFRNQDTKQSLTEKRQPTERLC